MIRWRRHPCALWRRSSDRVLVLPEGQGDVLLLDGSGALVWLLLEEPATAPELGALLVTASDRAGEEHGTPNPPAVPSPAVVERDLDTFLADLAEAGAVVATP